jgi:hypothetical protein
LWILGGHWASFKHIVAADFNGDGKVDIAGIERHNDPQALHRQRRGKLVGTGKRDVDPRRTLGQLQAHRRG